MTVSQATNNPNVAMASAINSGGAPINVASLSSEGLLFYCQNQLGAIDNDIKSYMANQSKNLQVKAALTKLKNTIGQHTPPKSVDALKDIAQAYKAALKELKAVGADASIVAAVGKSAAELANGLKKGWDDKYTNLTPFTWNNSAQSKVNALEDIVATFPKYWSESKAFYEGLGNDIGQLVEDVKGNAELQMIQLQSLVSARQTAVQLTTNMMNKVDQTLQSVVNNIK